MNAFIVTCSDGEMAEFPEGNCDIGQETQGWLQASAGYKPTVLMKNGARSQ